MNKSHLPIKMTSGNSELLAQIHPSTQLRSNPALIYIYSLATSGESGGGASARALLERFTRYFMGPASHMIDWSSLLGNHRLLKQSLISFWHFKLSQKSKLFRKVIDADNPFIHSEISPLVEAISIVASQANEQNFIQDLSIDSLHGQLTEAQLSLNCLIDSNNLLSNSWMTPVNTGFAPEITHSEKVANSLEAFASFCVGSCIERFYWDQFLYAPTVQSFMHEYLSNGVWEHGERVRDFSPSTADNLFRMIRGVAKQHWMSECMTVERLERIRAIKLPRGSRDISGRYVSNYDMDSIISVIDSGTNEAKRKRDKAIVAIMHACGLRRAEVVNLRMNDFDLSERSVHVIGKGNKERLVFYREGTTFDQALRAWIETRILAPGTKASDCMFIKVDKHGNTRNSGLVPQSINHICNWVINQGYSKKVSPHDFRHSYCTNLLKAGHDLLTVCANMGHSSVTTTQRYDNRGRDALRSATISY
ncbi:tyrosine-type recombinase/integrase [Vibrio owensii]|uniref:tyrosine-type recombinase/integrase n=1 Tax=Vibrio owensii TaxID=696485 RepID=UPI0040688011